MELKDRDGRSPYLNTGLLALLRDVDPILWGKCRIPIPLRGGQSGRLTLIALRSLLAPQRPCKQA
jgi:hypothetical protein